jgi:hypothetical protein
LTVYIGTKFQPEAVQQVKDNFANGNLKVEAPAAMLANIPEAQRDSFAQAFVNQTNSLLKTVTSDDISSTEIKYPDYIQNETDPAKKASEQQLYKASLQYIEGNVEAETQKRSSDAFSYVGVWIAIVQAFLTQRLAKRFKSAMLYKAGLVVMAAAIFLLLVPDQIGWLFLIFPLIALGNGLSQPNATAIISNSADAKSQGEVLGLNASIQSLSQALPSLASGYLAGHLSLSAPILVGGGIVIVAFLVMIFFYKDKDHRIVHEE